MKNEKHSLVGNIKHASGKYGGFSFGGCQPDGVKVHNPMGKGIEFPNGAKSALLLTFDVEGNYGNGTGSEDLPVLAEDVGPSWLTSTRIQKRVYLKEFSNIKSNSEIVTGNLNGLYLVRVSAGERVYQERVLLMK